MTVRKDALIPSPSARPVAHMVGETARHAVSFRVRSFVHGDLGGDEIAGDEIERVGERDDARTAQQDGPVGCLDQLRQALVRGAECDRASGLVDDWLVLVDELAGEPDLDRAPVVCRERVGSRGRRHEADEFAVVVDKRRATPVG